MSILEKALRLLGLRKPDEVIPPVSDMQIIAEDAFYEAEERNRKEVVKTARTNRFLRSLADPNVDETLSRLARELDGGAR